MTVFIAFAGFARRIGIAVELFVAAGVTPFSDAVPTMKVVFACAVGLESNPVMEVANVTVTE